MEKTLIVRTISSIPLRRIHLSCENGSHHSLSKIKSFERSTCSMPLMIEALKCLKKTKAKTVRFLSLNPPTLSSRKSSIVLCKLCLSHCSQPSNMQGCSGGVEKCVRQLLDSKLKTRGTFPLKDTFQVPIISRLWISFPINSSASLRYPGRLDTSLPSSQQRASLAPQVFLVSFALGSPTCRLFRALRVGPPSLRNFR
ncbi:hypothetical protein SCHPADRAFT_282432 [Schizopora paradoxa]|uniref:Uncharacterized protein n=1 Tax=Schizopora paradoxa TaxID=27342 RepID=A0A0H2RT12_9AGAM|nr:hypothetical protein SCHPADRAFT_282432 [Schizopora paradoxa]